MQPFQELLSSDRILVFDGAMGTMLYAKGVYINRCYDELNLSSPDLVQVVFESVLLQLVRRRAEGVGLDDVGARANVFGVDLAHQIGIAEIQLVVTTIDVDALCVEHRAHRAVHDMDAISFKEFAERLHGRFRKQ